MKGKPNPLLLYKTVPAIYQDHILRILYFLGEVLRLRKRVFAGNSTLTLRENGHPERLAGANVRNMLLR